jgi:hypothetical protein
VRDREQPRAGRRHARPEPSPRDDRGRERLGRQIGRRLRIAGPPHHVPQNLPHVSLVKAPEVLRLTARQQILIGELIADHAVPTISRLEPGLISFHHAVLLVGDE